MNAQNNQRSALLGAITFAVVCGWPFFVSGADTPPSSATPQEESATPGVESAPSPQTADEPPAGEIQERRVPRFLPGTLAPAPSGMAPPPGFVGATDNITKVGRALQVRAKSVTTLVTVAPGLSLTQPVTISIALGGYGPTRLTQSYVKSSGNHFLYNDPEGDGKPRRAFADITLTEPKPGGDVYTSTIPGSVMLDPLYDVTISPLEFSLIDNCDPVGFSEIVLMLNTPDAYSEVKFRTKVGRPAISFGQFAWSRPEISATANLHKPYVSFYESDPKLPFDFPHGSLPEPFINLLPGKTETLAFNLVEKRNADCRAYAKYTITYKLRWYPYL